MVCGDISMTLRQLTVRCRYATMSVGQPPQALEFDLDMLSPDFFALLTTSAEGGRFDTFQSSTYRMAPETIEDQS